MLSFLSPYKWIIGGVAIITLIVSTFFGIHKFLDYERNIGYQKAVHEYTEKLLAAEQSARAKEVILNNQIQKAQNDASIRDSQIDDLSKQLATTSSGLLDTIANLRRKLSAAPHDAANKQADTVLDVLGECQAKYGEVAEAADRHASDVKLLQDAWPK